MNTMLMQQGKALSFPFLVETATRRWWCPMMIMTLVGCTGTIGHEMGAAELGRPSDRPHGEAVDIFVENLNFYDAAIYVLADGVERRLGSVGGSGFAQFKMPRWAATAPRFWLVAELIGTDDRIMSRSIPNVRGLHVSWSLASRSANSLLSIRSY